MDASVPRMARSGWGVRGRTMAGAAKVEVTLRGCGRGIVAGVAATAVMSAWLGAAKGAGFLARQPPRIITEQTLPIRSETGMTLATIAGHLAYGAAAGVIYSCFVPTRFRGPVTGAAYGAALWVAGYEGWVPAMGVLPPGQRDDRRRVVAMLTGHLVYGATLGVIVRQ